MMKKMLALVSAMALSFGLATCAGAAQEDTTEAAALETVTIQSLNAAGEEESLKQRSRGKPPKKCIANKPPENWQLVGGNNCKI